jgi:hypothetical protein
MTYTRAADIYLGDVSSQVYEFLRTPKPCLFLNSSDAAWCGDESFHHWLYGPVLDTIERPDRRRRGGLRRPRRLSSRPRSGASPRASTCSNPSSVRAARAIVERLSARHDRRRRSMTSLFSSGSWPMPEPCSAARGQRRRRAGLYRPDRARPGQGADGRGGADQRLRPIPGRGGALPVLADPDHLRHRSRCWRTTGPSSSRSCALAAAGPDQRRPGRGAGVLGAPVRRLPGLAGGRARYGALLRPVDRGDDLGHLGRPAAAVRPLPLPGGTSRRSARSCG